VKVKGKGSLVPGRVEGSVQEQYDSGEGQGFLPFSYSGYQVQASSKRFHFLPGGS